ncbi:MAG: methyl-accepting chemotaxis protein [Telluria sp.]|nr:methyl-accepting chemotaxis protein [Telluria sp.]
MKQFIPLTIQVDRLARRFKSQFPHGISIDPTRSLEVNGRLTPLLRSGNATLNMDFSMPDQFSAGTGEGATIFVRTGSDFVRVTTSVKKPNGERPLGTSLDRAHPGYASLMAGRPYVGYATLFGIQYMTRYDPIFDAHNKVIGILYVGIDVSAYTPMGVSAKITLFVFVSSSVVLALMMWSFSAAMMPGGPTPVDPYALRNQYLMLSLLPLALMALVLNRVLHYTVTQPLAVTRHAAQVIAAGDLSEQLHVARRDEIGQLMHAVNTVSQGLAEIVGRVRQGADRITAESREIASGNADLSARTETQASALEEIASSIEELSSTVKQSAQNAEHVNSLVVNATDVAGKGGNAVAEVVRKMTSIREHSSRITDMIGVIEGIAFQTNILALNAAVEAARAGEEGRGFAVVAAEVRTLAQRTAAAAREIKSVIGDSVHEVESGGKLADEAGQTMSAILTSVKSVAGIMGEISNAGREQSSGIDEVNQAIVSLDRTTQQNAALVEEAAAAAESLFGRAEELSNVVVIFKVAK